MDTQKFGYKFLDFLGEGGFGKVSLCKNKLNQLVCVKQIKFNKDDRNQSLINLIKSEIYIMSQVQHPRIIKFIDTFASTGCVNIVMEYAPRGTLRSLIMKGKQLSETEVLKLFCDILMGLEYLHIRHVIHRDLKPENVLLGQDGRPKIADFGISSIHSKSMDMREQLGTPLYVAPEIIKGFKFDFKADVWSLGCMFYEICTFQNPFCIAKNRSELFNLVSSACYKKVGCSKLGYSASFQTLGEQMLMFDPASRISVPEIICNPLILMYYYNQYFNYKY